jgi:hypothetical protein
MIVAKSMEVRDNFKSWCVQAAEGEVIQISRPGNNYVYLINQETYEKISAERRIAAYTSYFYGKDKITNLKRLSDIESPQDNWNNNGVEKIPEKVIRNVRKLLMCLEFQPEVFPTACDAIQLEWDKANGEYLEMEIMEYAINVFQIDSDGGEKHSTIAIDGIVVKKIVGEFYDKAV